MMSNEMSDRSHALGEWLARHKDAVFDEEITDEHITDDRLAALAESRSPLKGADIEHLSRCAECLTVAADLYAEVRAADATERPPAWARRVPMIAGALAIAAGLLFVAVPRDSFRSKGIVTKLEADVVLLEGGTHQLRDGARIPIGAQLGFRYGNATGEHRTLTVLAWDGREVHWYYPETEAGTAFAIRADDDARNLRLPFDVKIGDTYRPGRLVVVAAFDVEPHELADALRADRTEDFPSSRVFELTIEGERP